MPALFQSSVRDFIDRPISEVVGTLSLHYAGQGFTDQKTDQTESWAADAANLQDALRQAIAISPHILNWRILLEFVIPRKDKRIDVVLLTTESIIILELKTQSGTEVSDCMKSSWIHLTKLGIIRLREGSPMPQQEVFFEQSVGERRIEVLKTYDPSFAREAFDCMARLAIFA
jgi:hypothetical protein